MAHKWQKVSFVPRDNIAHWRIMPELFDYSQRITQDDAVPTLKEILDRVSRGLSTGLNVGTQEYAEDDYDYQYMDKLDLADARIALAEREQQATADKQASSPSEADKERSDAKADAPDGKPD